MIYMIDINKFIIIFVEPGIQYASHYKCLLMNLTTTETYCPEMLTAIWPSTLITIVAYFIDWDVDYTQSNAKYMQKLVILTLSIEINWWKNDY